MQCRLYIHSLDPPARVVSSRQAQLSRINNVGIVTKTTLVDLTKLLSQSSRSTYVCVASVSGPSFIRNTIQSVNIHCHTKEKIQRSAPIVKWKEIGEIFDTKVIEIASVVKWIVLRFKLKYLRIFALMTNEI